MGIIEEGVYILESSTSNERFHLDGGDWKSGNIHLRKQNDGDKDKTADQQYLITLVPEDNPDQQFYHITNLFYGCQVGLYADDSGNTFQIKACPCALSEQSLHWKFNQVDSGFRISLRSDPSKTLDLGEHQSRISLKALTGAMTNQLVLRDDPNSEVWKLTKQWDYDSKSLSSWMSRVTNNPRLSMLNLVGTHQSLALHAKSQQISCGPEKCRNVTNVLTFNPLDNPRCQNRPPLGQLLDGVRELDLRFHCWTSNKDRQPSLFAWHGINNPVIGCAQGYSFGACLQTLKHFLTQCPSETVIINVTNETHDDSGLFESCFNNDAREFSSLFYHKSPGKESMHQISLDEVRGKVILVTTNLPISDFVLDRNVFFGGNGAEYHNEDSWDKPPKEWPNKIQACRDNLSRVREDRDENHTYQTCWNMSNAVSFPPYNPIDFYFAAKDAMKEELNEGKIGKGGQFRTGLVMLDFYELSLEEVLAVVRSNPGCEDVQL